MDTHAPIWALEWIGQTGLDEWIRWTIYDAKAELENLRCMQKEDGYEWEGAPDFEKMTYTEFYQAMRLAIKEADSTYTEHEE